MYWTPRNESHAAWNMPQTLKAQGIDDVEVKNQNIFMASPASQLARTESRNPLQERDRAFERICGMGSVASTERPMMPIADEYDWYTEGMGASRSSQTTRPANRESKNCQYLSQTSVSPVPPILVCSGNPRLWCPPLPEVERPLCLVGPGERDSGVASLRVWRRTVVQGDLQQDHLHGDHDERLDEERLVEFCTGVVENPGALALAGV